MLLRYPTYKSSGTEWLAVVPSHWTVQPAVTLCRVLTSTTDKKSYEGETAVRLCNYTDVYYNDRITDNRNFMKSTASSEQIRKFSVRAGDIPFTKDSETADDIGISSFVPNDLPGTVYGYHLGIYRPLNVRRSRFLKYLLDSKYAKTYFETSTPGVTRVGLSQQVVRYFRVPTPPVEEAVAIADYLDRETAQIDAFIAKNENLVTLLTERRRATVLNAVTKGIEEKATRRDSGADWLGAVPVHWPVLPLKASIRSSKNGTWGEDPDGGASDVRCVRVADFDRPQQRVHDKSYTNRKVATSERLGRELRSGDLLLEKSGGGDKSPVGFVVLYDRNEPAVCSNFVARLELAGGMDPRFWTYVHGAMYASRITERSLKQSTGIQNLDQGQYFSERVAVPPFEEQKHIADHLDERTKVIDQAISTARGANALAKERRSALISAAVTGQLDIREAS